MNITDNISNPAKINQQAFFLESHQKLNPNARPSPAEKNTGCFTDMLQRAKNVELKKINSVNKSQEIWKSLKIDTIRTSYTRMAEQLFSFNNKENINLNLLRSISVYTDNSFSIQSLNKNYNNNETVEIKKIDLFI